jgi:hypothetical protein
MSNFYEAGFAFLGFLAFFTGGFGASYPKRAHAAGSTGIGFVRPVFRFTNTPENGTAPVLNIVQRRL